MAGRTGVHAGASVKAIGHMELDMMCSGMI